MLIVNLLNGVMLASLVCFAVGAVLLAILATRSAGREPITDAGRPKNLLSRVQGAFEDPRFRIARTLLTAGGLVAVASFVAVFVISASLPRCTASPEDLDEAVAMCMPVVPAPVPAA
ncbi:MAG: hypothetical protein JWP26_4345 [Devosia sp.]|uniref:hypothetical protein n=1 Tax=Devosia sp. TaxID=1871048 RepID=UPI00260D0C68|nr:hypothetical protein [Devosia sp.]MDB5589375.1 hypothetical protein [Devosia sp.]